MMSWSTADVKGANNVGGIAGSYSRRSADFSFKDNWVAGNVVGDNDVGGFYGQVFNGNEDHNRNWSSGAVSGASNVGGFVGSNDSEFVNVPLSIGTRTQAESRFWMAPEWTTTPISAWFCKLYPRSLLAAQPPPFGHFGDIDISDGVADFPLLTVHSQPWQAVNLARALTRILGVGDAATIVAAAGTTITTDALRLDTNGLAADTGSGGTSIPSCSFDGGVLRAQTNYNGVTVELSMLTSEGANLSISADPTACEAIIEKADKEFAATLRLEISAPAASDDDPARTLTTDYALRIAPPAARPSAGD